MEAPYYPASTDGELLPVVDAEDRVTGAAPRAEIHAQGLYHRAIHVLLLDERGAVALQRRSLAKDHFPGCWDISVGGHVNVGESYLYAAVRECREEMGVTLAPEQLRWLAVFPPTATTGWEFIHVFAATVRREDVRPDPDEIIGVRWLEPGELKEGEAWPVEPFTVPGRETLKACLEFVPRASRP